MDTPLDRPPLPRPAPAQPMGSLIVGWLRWFGMGRLVVTVVAVLAVAGGGVWLLRASPTPVESTLPYAGSATSTTASVGPPASATAQSSPQDGSSSTAAADDAADAPVVVFVTGAVTAPGVYSLASNARVEDAVSAAGGMATDADIDAVNLAAFVSDGTRIYVPRIGVPVPAVVTPSGGAPVGDEGGEPGHSVPSAPIDLNTATAEMFDQLPGIGPATAAAIVAHRESSGPFATVDDLLEVRGIGPAKLDAIRTLVTV